jgi:hypothetical protein
MPFFLHILKLASIRAYGAEATFIKESLDRIDKYTRAARTFYNLNRYFMIIFVGVHLLTGHRWVGMRIDALGGLFSAGLAGYLVYADGFATAASSGFLLNQAGILSR